MSDLLLKLSKRAQKPNPDQPILTLEELEKAPPDLVKRYYDLEVQEAKDSLLERYQEDFFAFCEDVFGLDGIVVEKEDRKYVDLLLRPFLDPSAPRKIHVERPRGTRKTLLGAQALPVWLYTLPQIPGILNRKGRPVRGRNLRVLIISESRSLAKEAMKTQREVMESELFVELYGSFAGNPWNDESYTLSVRSAKSIKEPTCKSAGIDVQVTGGHYDLIIADDLVTLKNSGTAEQIEKCKEVFRMLSPLLEAGGVMIVYGTRYNEEDLYGDIIRKNQKHKSYEILIESSVSGTLRADAEGNIFFPEDDSRYLFPKTLPRSVLVEHYHSMDVVSFTSQYLNECLPASRQIFTKEHFRFLRHELISTVTRRYLVTDTAVSDKDEGCRSVIIVIDVEPSKRRVVRDYAAGLWTPEVFLDNLFDLARKYRPVGITLEEATHNEVYKTLIEQRMHRQGLDFSLIKIEGRSLETKDSRVRRLQPHMRDGNLVFDSDIFKLHPDFHQDFIHEFLFYRPGKKQKNDVPDALADAFAEDRKLGIPLLLEPSSLELAQHEEFQLWGFEPKEDSPIESSGGDSPYYAGYA